MISKLSSESVEDFLVEFLSKGLTRSIGLKSGFLTISGSAVQKTLEELIAVNDGSLSDLTEAAEVADDSSVFVVIDGKFCFTVSVVSVDADDFVIVIALNIEVPDVSVLVLPRFLFAKSYMSPNIPANVFLKFFIVSSASSATEVCPVTWRCGACLDVVEIPDTVDDCDACESLRPTLDNVGAFSVGCSGGSDETLLRLPCRPIDPGPGVVRSGIGGGPLVETGRGPAGTGGIFSFSVGLPPREEIDDREAVFANCGRHTF